MTMGGVGAQADVTGHQQGREGLPQQTDSLNSWGVLRVSCRALFILEAGEGQGGIIYYRCFSEGVVVAIKDQAQHSPFVPSHSG